MSYELATGAEIHRLNELYRAMSDGELLQLAERPEDLTEVAQQVLRGELSSRRLQVVPAPAAGFTVAPERFAKKSFFAPDEYSVYTQRAPDLKPAPAAKGLAKGTVVLTTFHDAIAAGEACDLLEAEGFEIDVRDMAKEVGGGSSYGGPPVALQVIVQQSELQRAMDLLQAKMGLFPKQEVEVADDLVDDGTTAVLGYFGHRNDAEEVAQVLEAANVWHRISANAEGSVADENSYSLEVKEIDLVRAGEIVESALNLPEE